ncbi:MAG: hypothetical protein KXJ53_00215 [Phenylobacterium sp.]|jgi:uncharacterized membrane protein|nr:hypothetical protein [Phenylobacterium sp.]
MKVKALVLGAAIAAAVSSGAAAMDLSRDIDARRAKPDWSLKVTGGTKFTLSRPGKAPLRATAPGVAISPREANWSAKAADGASMNVTLQAKSCTLGRSQYPMTAQVVLGSERLSGCADYKR